jgi:hypothetical protein
MRAVSTVMEDLKRPEVVSDRLLYKDGRGLWLVSP